MSHRLAAIVLLGFVLVSFGWGGELSLDGPWQLCRAATAERPPADAEWETVQVPSLIGQAAGEPFLWYRRTFRVPADWKEPHLFLRFGAVRFVSEVAVNGQKAGAHFGGWEPFELDISRLARRGADNDLLVRVQDVTGVIAQEMGAAKRTRGSRFIDQATDSVMAPVGSQYTRVGIWEPVALIARNDVHIDDVFVKTSFRKREIEAEITVRNLADQPRTATLQARVLNWPDHMGAPVRDLGKHELTVPARSTARRVLRRGWEKPRSWSLDSPSLYVLSILLKEGQDTLDTATPRFGFREFWTDGPNLVLNGTPIKFLATAGHPHGQIGNGLGKEAAKDFYRRIRQAGCVAMRLHANVWPECWYEAADEVGMPLIMESALFCYARNYALTKPEFWKNYHDHLAAIVRHKRNHPSIVMYSLENEILHCGGERCADDCVHRLAEAGRFLKKLDPTRPIMYDADGDPEGVADVVNLHYPLDFDKQNLWPNCARWLEKGAVVRGWPHKFYKWDRKKPLYFGEFLHLQHYTQADNYTTLLGDEAYVGHDIAMARCKARAWEMQIQAYRAADVSGTCPWTLTETGDFPSDDNPRYLAVKRAYQPIAAFIRERDSSFYAGDTVTRTVDLHNDTLRPARLAFEWTLKEDAGLLASGRREFDTQPAQRIPFSFTMKIPQRAEPAHATLRWSVSERGKPKFGDWVPCTLHPRQPLCVPKNARIALFDPKASALGKALREAGASVQTVPDLATLPQCRILLIAPHALDGLKPPEGIPTVGDRSGPRAAVADFVRAGGTVVALEQDSYDCGLLPARLMERACSVAFGHSGLGSDFVLGRPSLGGGLLSFWHGDHVVARKTIAKPQHGRFLAIADSGGPDGLVYLPLLEVRDGKGRYLLSQCLIGEKLATEPKAQNLLEALLRDASREPVEPVGLSVVQGELRMTEVLDEIGVVYADVTGQLAGVRTEGGPVLAEADAPEVARNVATLRRFVEQGGTLILHAGTRDGIARLGKLFPEPIVAQANTSVPVNISVSAPPIEGLSNQDLYWYGDRSGLSWRVRTPLSPDVCDHVIGTGLPDPKACRTFPAARMATTHGQPQVRGREVYMYATAGLKTAVHFPKDGEYAFIVRGKGTPVAGVYPQIAIAIDGRRLGSITTAGTEWGEYFLTAQVPKKGSHEISLAFVNDAWDPDKGEDRNVTLDWLRVGPVPAMKAKRLLNPPALVKMPLGKGVILFDQVRWDKRPGDEKAGRYLSNLLTNLGCDFRSPVGGVTIQSTHLKPKGELRLWRSQGGVLSMGTNGTVATRIRFAKPRRYRFAVRAWGTQAAGEFPNIAVSIDGKKTGDLPLRRPGWHTVRLDAHVAAGEHEVALSFTNDYYDKAQDPPADRNLRIAALRID